MPEARKQLRAHRGGVTVAIELTDTSDRPCEVAPHILNAIAEAVPEMAGFPTQRVRDRLYLVFPSLGHAMRRLPKIEVVVLGILNPPRKPLVKRCQPIGDGDLRPASGRGGRRATAR